MAVSMSRDSLTTNQLAKATGRHPDWLRRQASVSGLCRKIGRDWMWSEEAVAHYRSLPETRGRKAMGLERVFDELTWRRKYEDRSPRGVVFRVFRPGQEREAQRFFRRNLETTFRVSRAAFLVTDSLGQAIVITEDGSDNC